MRTLSLSAVLVLAASGAAAEAPPTAGKSAGRPASPALDCRDARITEAGRAAAAGPQRLAVLPEAWRLHAVVRQVGGCQVHPEARKVSDRTGRSPQAEAPRR